MLVLLTTTIEDMAPRELPSLVLIQVLLHGDQSGFGLQILHYTLQSRLRSCAALFEPTH